MCYVILYNCYCISTVKLRTQDLSFHSLTRSCGVCVRATSTSFSTTTRKCLSCGTRSSRRPETSYASVTSWTRGLVRWDFPSLACVTWPEASICWTRLDFSLTLMISMIPATVPTGNDDGFCNSQPAGERYLVSYRCLYWLPTSRSTSNKQSTIV